MYPEEGRSAIAAAAKAIADFKLGRVDEESTANVGLINGGTAGNIVPEWCTFLADVRSHDQQKLADLVREMLEAVDVRGQSRGLPGRDGGAQELQRLPLQAGRRSGSDRQRAALERAGFEPTFTLSGGAADANVFNERGLACVNLANGMAEIHTPDEHIAVADLERMVDVTLALVDVARETDAA